MIDRRHLLLGGLAGLLAPAILDAQPVPGGGPGGAGGGAGGLGQGAGPAGAGGSRIPARGERRDNAGQQQSRPDRPVEQPPQIRALILSQSYRTAPGLALANTTRDAALIAQSFVRLHFDSVIMQNDGAPADALARIGAYLGAVDANTIALVYVAGHGVEIGGENLLLLEDGRTFLSLQALIQTLQARAGVAILFLDACRNNPFAGGAAAGSRIARAIAPGPQEIRLQTASVDELRTTGHLRAFSLQGSGIKIVFSTDPANVAYDAVRPSSRNGPFAAALARRIAEPVSLDDIVSLTTGDVLRATRREQSPWSQGSIDRPIFLSGRRRRQQARYG